ncbi:MAG TPA: hypothetical protein VKB93_11700 [Thermoanaerobaculia bacterium]|nr:hypothetical protein [Thermoanaerobaculia bacterium]
MSDLPLPTLSEAASLSLAWIGEAAELLTERDTPQLLQAYLAAAVCGDMLGESQDEAARQVEDVRARLAGSLNAGFARCDGTSVLLGCALESRIFGETLPAFRDYAAAAASALEALPASVSANEFPAAAMLLARLGLLPEPPSPASSYSPDLYSLLTADRKTVRENAARIEALTRYGTRPIETPLGLGEVLECVMMEALRRYDMELACTLLRSLLYLGRRAGRAVDIATHFLLTNETAGGNFGFFDEEIKLLGKKMPEPLASLTIQLPVSLACLWALAEAGLDEYRLFRDLGSRVARVRIAGGLT